MGLIGGKIGCPCEDKDNGVWQIWVLHNELGLRRFGICHKKKHHYLYVKVMAFFFVWIWLFGLSLLLIRLYYQ